MPKFKISRFCTSTANREFCTTKSGQLGVKTRSRLSPKALTRRIPPREHVLPSGTHRPDRRKLKISLFPSFFFNDSTHTSISFYPAGGPNVIGSNNRTNGSPPHGFPLRKLFLCGEKACFARRVAINSGAPQFFRAPPASCRSGRTA